MRNSAQKPVKWSGMPASQKKELSGWKAIADYLEVSIRTAQQREKDLGLPIQHEPGPKGRVFADLDELEAWRKRTRANGLGACNRWDPEPASPASARRIRPRALWMVAVPAVALLAAAAYVLTPHGPVSDFRVDGKNLIVVNAKGQELWRHTFGVSLNDVYYGNRKVRLSWLGDITGDGRPELLFVVSPVNVRDVGTQLLCFGTHGEIKWQFGPGRPVMNGRGDRLLPPYLTDSLQVFVDRRPERTRIAVSSLHHLDPPDQVAFLDANGHVVGEYWHPGYLEYSSSADLDNDGTKELLLGGVNNGNHQATVVVLDPLQIQGLMTPKEMLDHRFELLGMPAAKEKAVVFFPRSCISRGQSYTRVQSLWVTPDRVIAVVAEGEADNSPGFIYQLDYGLHVRSVESAGLGTVRAHQALEARGEVDHPFSEECARLKAGVVVRRAGLKADR
jgi:hypothetical protein